MSSITQEQRSNLELLHKKRVFQANYPRFIIQQAHKHLTGLLLVEIKQRMRERDYSEKIIEDTRIGDVNLDMKIGRVEYEVVCDYVTVSNFDISDARENTGTISHFIKPLVTKALHFIFNGIEMFSKGHWVRGIVASHIIADTMKELEPLIEQYLKEEGDNLFKTMVGVSR